MYIPPGFTVITCKAVDEEAFRAWAVDTGGVWHLAKEDFFGFHPARATWDFGPYQEMTAKLRVLREEDKAEWIPRERMHAPPQGLIEVELSEEVDNDDTHIISVLQSLFAQWDSYIHDLGAYEWGSALLAELLPSVRLLQRELPPPRPPILWIWVGSKYVKNEAYQ